MNTVAQDPRISKLLDQITTRGYDRAAVEQCLSSGVLIRYQYPDQRGNSHYDVSVGRPDRPCQLQMTIGPDGRKVGCVTCTREQTNGRYAPVLVQDCPAVGAAMVAYALTGGTISRAGNFVSLESETSETQNPEPGTKNSELTNADAIAADIIAEYGHDFGGRIERALELVKAGETEFPHYNTSYAPIGFYGLRVCFCKDAQHRAPRANWGVACKHCLAQEIKHRLDSEAEATAYRKHTDRFERYRSDGLTVAEQRAQARASLGGALRPDPINRTARRPDFNRRRK